MARCTRAPIFERPEEEVAEKEMEIFEYLPEARGPRKRPLRHVQGGRRQRRPLSADVRVQKRAKEAPPQAPNGRNTEGTRDRNTEQERRRPKPHKQERSRLHALLF
ncbi:hypothetical protein L596_019453 [Steinernema carpocapsae]|uniref:Uncharacterized protein n=1 Tax=Steinernema carpocapsae TaxID=34508 RepID=A0A4U5MQP5_STECR|nr:hypothetical protein L596_019453 [Steinernema carpocapsae]